ncbi:hypothetical protein FYK55_27625 [Roseiconus nitratireducens]|uniref:Lipocalin-like protein n=1 Tax=Roseiconus nitratireducens TaxID=2605748 RepID=A0A5M6CU00_9BACT|nr:hypothetical protein [Roseiconus nitratireducens]KAA5538513.1 hypothetical protein FYK55_27625 [Roseiconus nitratireducens]
MKRLTYILLAFATLLSVLLTASTATADEGTNASNTELEKMLIGAWQLKTAENPGSPSGIGTRLKLFTGTHWCVIQPDPTSGMIVFQHGGHYSFDGMVLSETIDFAGDSTSSLIGKTFKHKLEITKDSLKQMDTEGVFNETWERAKAASRK